MRIGKKATLAIVLVLLIALLSALIYVIVDDVRQQREYEKNYYSMQSELINSGLLTERAGVERDIRRLSNKEAKRLATVTLLCKTPSQVVYNRIRPILSHFGMNATVCISASSMPGDEGNMTAAQYKSLVTRGYFGAVLYDGTGELSEYLSALSARASALGIAMPDTMYVYGKTGDTPYRLYEYDADGKPIITDSVRGVLSGYGIKHVVQETYQEKVVSYLNFYEPLEYCEALGFNSKKIRDSFDESVRTHAAIVMSLQFTTADNYGSYFGDYDGYSYEDTSTEELIERSLLGDLAGTSADSFIRMLNLIKTEYAQSVKVMGVSAAAKYREEFNLELELDTETEERLAECYLRLEEINIAIREIEKKYGY